MEKRGTETLNSEKWSKLRCDIEKLRSEIIDESVKIHDELRDEMRENLSLDLKEIQISRAQLAVAKHQAVIYVVGTLVFMFAAGLGLMRLLK